MAISPGTYNFILQRRSDWSVILQFKDSNDAAIDLTGYTVYAQAWNETRLTKYADFAVAYTDRSAGGLRSLRTPKPPPSLTSCITTFCWRTEAVYASITSRALLLSQRGTPHHDIGQCHH